MVFRNSTTCIGMLYESKAVLKRIKVVKYVNPLKDHEIIDDWMESVVIPHLLPRILKGTVDGAFEWRLKGLMHPAWLEDNLNEYIDQSNSVDVFINEAVELGHNPKETRVLRTKLYEWYTLFCQMEKHDSVKVGYFYQRIREKWKILEVESSGADYFAGIKLIGDFILKGTKWKEEQEKKKSRFKVVS